VAEKLADVVREANDFILYALEFVIILHDGGKPDNVYYLSFDGNYDNRGFSMENTDYILTIKIDISAIDDAKARKEAQEIIKDVKAKCNKTSLKEIFDNKPPRNVEL